ncbi:MAG: chalcone isomerase family protein [Desulfamplus sp.]|nr:chalcone isomerase family protein [Desulfamplus sp.]
MLKKVFFVLFAVFFTVTPLYAAKIGGVEVADTITLEDGKGELVLNGAGIRSKFGFKVYVGSLYLKAKTSDSQQIINSDEPMAITMTWTRTGPPDKLVDVFAEGFKYAAGDNYDAQKTNIDAFLGAIVKASKTDIWRYIYMPGQGTSIYYNDEFKLNIPDLDFKKALFSVWLLETDTFTGDEKLRDGMLGK